MKTHKLFNLWLIALLIVCGSTVAASAQSEWKNLGDEHVNFDVDHDTIHVADSGRIRELRLSVKDAPVKFMRVVINYTDGTKQDLEYIEDVAIGGHSRIISLGGDGHPIKSVEFWYETASLGGKKAHVTLYGRDLAPMTTMVPASNQGEWKKLGDEHVNFDVDHDTIHVRDSGRFREMRLSVMDAPIKFRRVVINYTDGPKEELEYLEDVAAGLFSRIIPISGDGRVIKSVEFWYETASLGGKKAHVTLYGREFASPAPMPSMETMAQWKKLGDEHVNFDVDHDTIHVRDSGRFREMRLSVMDAPIKFRRVVINYTDGPKQELEYLEDVAVGVFSRIMPISGDGRVIKSVEFWYETASLGGKKAHVTLYGR